MNVTHEAIEAAVNAYGEAHNPKWHHPIFGYETFSEDQKGYLRDQARLYLEAAAPLLMAQAWSEGWDAAAGWPQIDINPYDPKR